MNRELEMAKLACRALDEKKGKDIKVIDIHEVSVIADYLVIASASNQNQVQAMVDNVDETDLKQNRLREPETPAGFLRITAI